jgi:hypothetical protein
MIGKRQEKLAIIQSLASVQSTVLLSNPPICFQSAVISPSQTNSPAAPPNGKTVPCQSSTSMYHDSVTFWNQTEGARIDL